MSDAIRFFQQYESVIYFILAIGIVVYGWRFYAAWQELRGSVFGLEQVGAQRRLTRSALSIFVILLVGVGVFSLVTFAQPILESAESAGNYLGFSDGADGISGENNSSGIQSTQDSLATATPLPTVAVDPSACDPEKIMITSPLPNEEIRGVVEIKGIVNVDDFGAYIIELAKAEEALWLPIQAHRTLVTEEGVLMEWDSSLTPPGSYVLQLRVTTHDGEDYEPCRVPIRVGNP
jgi:hypothetical protein